MIIMLENANVIVCKCQFLVSGELDGRRLVKCISSDTKGSGSGPTAALFSSISEPL